MSGIPIGLTTPFIKYPTMHTEIALNHLNETVIYEDGDFTLLKVTANSRHFGDVVLLREEHSNDITDSYDQNASIYVIYQQNVALGTARIIEAQTSTLDFEAVLSFSIEPRFRQLVCSTSRLAITQKQKTPKMLANLLVGLAGQDQFCQGVRFDLMACRERLIPYYKRMGHQILPYPPIIHPRTGATCHLMLLALTLTHTRFTDQYFSHLPDKLIDEAVDFLKQISSVDIPIR